jgi:pyruvate formate lyase activating enzyme
MRTIVLLYCGIKVQAALYTAMDKGRVRCLACRRYCILGSDQRGFCGVRANRAGSLLLENYGQPAAVHLDPIEKKPVLHAHPGSKIFSIGTTGCNYACQYCQNWQISQDKSVGSDFIRPDEIVSHAIKSGAQGIAYTYNEPTIFIEYARDIGLEARNRGLFNIFVTNGYETPESVKMSAEFLDFATVDFKGNGATEFYRKYISVPSAEPIYETISLMLDQGIHVEITDLVVPEVGDRVNDLDIMLRKIMDTAGSEVPISFLRFHPDYRMMDLPVTTVETLESHWQHAVDMGFKYVYIGNVPGHRYQNTYCPACKNIVVRRDGFKTNYVRIAHGRCEFCHEKIPYIM